MTKHLGERIRHRRQADRVHDRRATEIGRQSDPIPWEVDDPYEPGATIVVLRERREDPLFRLHSHHQVDQAQFMAGRAYQRDWETAERGARAIDPTREAVDGGQLAEPVTEGQRKARIRLVRIQRELGRKAYKLVHAVLINGQHIEHYAQGLGVRGESWMLYYGRAFRDALDTLAVEYNLAGKGERDV